MTDLVYDVVYSRRKTIALSLGVEGALTVRAPFHTSRAVIEDVILQHRTWILDKQEKLAEKRALYPRFLLSEGALLPYFGGQLTVRPNESSEIRQIGDELLLPPQITESDLSAWLKASLRPVLSERIQHYSEVMGVTPQGITVTSAKTRWGSCSSINRLSFSFRLAFCPIEVIDYVVVHELAHIRYKNHGQQFWQQVAAIIPEYRLRRDWLKENALLMEILA
ncbi:MAG: M48 family metallopeptidase [Clostridia bacterium]|nr:M48 family metallopeptidase [Clostridia bacterium]